RPVNSTLACCGPALKKPHPAMALQGPFVVVADHPAPDVVEALQAAGAFPIIETNWTDAAAALASVEPEGLVLAEPCGDPARAEEFGRALEDSLMTKTGGRSRR